ncbi:hypothetical protein [Clostridium rectalis]|uniref:hypothetical protein n=1 Tax=Clostridium rectalis TaxID=2040295 RepID=UPI000F630BFD|nr:hypothetical protein [Clostridium rectalis]
MNKPINPVKQNVRVKQYLGWFITFTFPLAVREIMELTKSPFLAALAYWIVCGILLRFTIGGKLPYFKPQWKKVKKETIILFLSTILCGYLYVNNSVPQHTNLKDMAINIFLFAILNGTFEHLVWINIFDLAGSKIKINGFIASFIYTGLIHMLFWSEFMPTPVVNTWTFLVCQAFMFTIPYIIYIKTEDITIWSIQHIIYNFIAVIFMGFGASGFIHLN